jgi:hypothetical protein
LRLLFGRVDEQGWATCSCRASSLRQGSRAVEARTASAAAVMAVRVEVAAARRPPAVMHSGWTVLELAAQAVATRVMWVSAVVAMR